jgi:hypothetical protein
MAPTRAAVLVAVLSVLPAAALAEDSLFKEVRAASRIYAARTANTTASSSTVRSSKTRSGSSPSTWRNETK